MSRFLYTVLLYLLLPFTPIKLLWRGMRQPEYRQHLGERYGWYTTQAQLSTKPLIWLHCVSVGETRGAAPLVMELQKRYPQHRILLTHATPTGRAAGVQLFGDTVQRAYLPYDVPGAVQRFLQHYRPVMGLLMETELWFNLIAACKLQRIPLLLVNARLSARSASGYAKTGALARQGLQALSAIAAQTADDAARLAALGARDVAVLGNLKFDVIPPADAAQQGALLRGMLGPKRAVFLAASTRDGEEALILQAVARAQIPNLLTIIVPRHPQRFEEVAALLKKSGQRYMRRSHLGLLKDATQHDPTQHDATQNTAAQNAIQFLQENQHATSQEVNSQAENSQQTEVNVLLGDSMGEMFSYYAACDVAFIGGSLMPLGGQNLIEASAMGKPVLIGPHTFNFTAVTELAIAAGAAWRVKDSADLAEALQQLFGDPQKRQRMSLAALQFSTGAGGATQRVADLVQRYLPLV